MSKDPFAPDSDESQQLPLPLLIPFSGDFTIRVMDRGGEPWFVAIDACAALGIVNVSDAISRLDDDEKDDIGISDTIGRIQKVNLISESGLYALIFRSNKPEAKRFSKWVRSEVLPMIRRTGQYAPGKVKHLLPRKYRQLRASGYSNDEAMEWHERDLFATEAYKDISREWFIRNGDFPRLVNHSTRFVLGMSSSAWKRKHKTKESPRRYMSSVKKTALGLVEGIAAGFHRKRHSHGTEALERDITDAASVLDWDRLNELLPDTDIVPTPRPDQKKLLPG